MKHNKIFQDENFATIIITSSGAYYSLDTNTPLYLGGVDYNYPFLPQSTYHGCIKDLYIGILPFLLFTAFIERQISC